MENTSIGLDLGNAPTRVMAPNSVDFPTLKATMDQVNSSESTHWSDQKFPTVAEAQPTPPPSKSFAEALSNPSLHRTRASNVSDLQKFFLANSKPVDVGKQATLDGRQTLIFSDMETLSFAAAYRFALVGKFSHRAPQCLHRLVAGLGIQEAFTVFKWTPTFTPAQESSVVPIWISFPELPAHLFDKDTLYAVPSMVGMPLQIDDFTFNQSKLSKAKVCIEIDLLTPLVQEFDIQINGISIVQKVEYEQVPKYCNLCKHVGHQESECYSKGNNPKPASRR
ncbi:UNVERIFIED_CONTAM: hypothetical protein Sindi_2343100 [Sesamum indicum]